MTLGALVLYVLSCGGKSGIRWARNAAVALEDPQRHPPKVLLTVIMTIPKFGGVVV